MLLYAQDEKGYLSDAVIEEVAERIGITELDVRNVLSYYSMLRLKPAGQISRSGVHEHQLHVARSQRTLRTLQNDSWALAINR